MFVYTQTAGERNTVELKEWIYARGPNNNAGSAWQWILKSEMTQWPLTLDMGDNGQARIERNMPFAGIPIASMARSKYMLDVLVHHDWDNVRKYFPFHEEISTVPPVLFWTSEGIQRQADLTVVNTSAQNAQKPPRGIDWPGWDARWGSALQVSLKAKPQEYPLLIDPSFVFSSQ